MKTDCGFFLFQIAFKGHPLSNTVYTSPETVEKITKDILLEYKNSLFVGSRMVITGCGVNHNEFVELVNSHFGDLPKTSSKVSISLNYNFLLLFL
jgi:predicted Zn-dependent peptidase